MFDVRRVDREIADSIEQLGSKPKFRFRDGDRHFLFKADNRGTGEDWAEVIASHLCELLGLPHVKYELAEEYDHGNSVRPGVVCEYFAVPPIALVHGNELLVVVDPAYPKEQRYRVRQHTVDAVCDVVRILLPPVDWLENARPVVRTGIGVFVGYVLLDAWIANQDRHHQNWAALWDGHGLKLAPTFDHGAGLARNLTDDERQERLETKDRNRTLVSFAGRASSAFYADSSAARPLSTHAAFSEFARRSPDGASAWLTRLEAVTDASVQGILEQVPVHRMTRTAREFTLQLLKENRARLLAEHAK